MHLNYFCCKWAVLLRSSFIPWSDGGEIKNARGSCWSSARIEFDQKCLDRASNSCSSRCAPPRLVLMWIGLKIAYFNSSCNRFLSVYSGRCNHIRGNISIWKHFKLFDQSWKNNISDRQYNILHQSFYSASLSLIDRMIFRLKYIRFYTSISR